MSVIISEPPTPPITPPDQWSNGNSVTFTGSGFGIKSPAAPAVFDPCTGSDSLATLWSGAWPNAGNASYFTDYRTTQRGVSYATPFMTRYICGAHGENLGAAAGYNVMFWKNRTIGALPQYTYASWYSRADPSFVLGIGSPNDDNFKTYDWSIGTSPYDPANWYTAMFLNSTTSDIQRVFADDDGAMSVPDQSGNNSFLITAPNPIAGWIKEEMEIRFDTTTAGYFNLFINCVLNSKGGGYSYHNPTAGGSYSGTSRNDGIGGYCRDQGNANNWRYFGSIYLDYTLQRVMLGNASTLAACTIREPQPATAWSDTSITLTVNQGNITAGTRYVFVLNAAGAVVASFSVTVP